MSGPAMRSENFVVRQKAHQSVLPADGLILAKDPEYGDSSELSQPLEEVSKLLEADSWAILNSDF